MANRIAGITIEIDGKVDKLQHALQDVDKSLRTTQSNLRDVNKLLKLDPGNVTLLKQKQDLLASAIKDTKEKIDKEKEALAQLKAADQTPEVKRQAEALERQIIADEQALESLQKQQKDFGSVGKQVFQAVGDKVKEVGDKIKAVGENVKEFGEGLTKHVTAPLAALGGASLAAFDDVDKGLDTIIQKTGATGEAAAAMGKSMENLATQIPTDFETAGAAIGEVNTRFGLTGQELETLSGQFIKFAELNNTDVSTSIDSVQKALAAYGLGAEDAGAYLDRLNKTGQDTGVSVDSLAAGIVSNATAFQEMGLSIDEATAFMGQLEKSGANSETVLNGMRKALKNATAEGKPLDQALAELQQTILNGTGSMDGLTAAYEIFGKSGDQIYSAVRNGTVDFTNFAGSVSDASGSVSDTFEATLDPMDSFKTTMNDLKLLGAEVGGALGQTLKPAIEKVRDVIVQLKAKWDELSPETQDAIVKAALIAATVGPVLVVLGTLISTIGSIVSGVGSLISFLPMLAGPFGIVAAVIAGAVAAGVLLYKNWDKIKEWAGKLKDGIVKAWNQIKKSVSDAVKKVKDTISKAWNNVKTTASNTWNGVKTTVSNAWSNIKTTTSNAVSNVKTAISNGWNNAKTATTNAWNGIKSGISIAWGNIKSTVSGAASAVSSTMSSAWSSIKSTVSNAWSGIKSTVSSSASSVKSTMSNAWAAAKSNASTVWAGIKTAITNPIQTAKSTLSTLASGIKSVVNFSGISNGVKTAFEAVKKAITDPIGTAKELVDKAVGTIKGLFPIKMGKIFSGIQLPHFKISGGKVPWGIGGQGVKPSVSIQWYRKAYDQPYLFTQPTVVGGRGFGDGRGGEIVYGHAQLMRDIAAASAANSGDITINVYAREGMNVNQLANAVQLRLAQVQRQKERAYA